MVVLQILSTVFSPQIKENSWALRIGTLRQFQSRISGSKTARAAPISSAGTSPFTFNKKIWRKVSWNFLY